MLPDPAEVGVDSDARPGVLRKTDLEIYRWLATVDHYEHLAKVVRLLERANAAGCSFDGLLKTRAPILVLGQDRVAAGFGFRLTLPGLSFLKKAAASVLLLAAASSFVRVLRSTRRRGETGLGVHGFESSRPPPRLVP